MKDEVSASFFVVSIVKYYFDVFKYVVMPLLAMINKNIMNPKIRTGS